MVSKEEAMLFVDKNVGVTHRDSPTGSSEGLTYHSGLLVKITDNSIILEKFGKRILITLDSIIMIREKDDG